MTGAIPTAPGARLRAVVQADDRLVLVFEDGTVEPVIAPGHARPSGWSSVAPRRKRVRA